MLVNLTIFFVCIKSTLYADSLRSVPLNEDLELYPVCSTCLMFL